MLMAGNLSTLLLSIIFALFLHIHKSIHQERERDFVALSNKEIGVYVCMYTYERGTHHVCVCLADVKSCGMDSHTRLEISTTFREALTPPRYKATPCRPHIGAHP